LQGNVSVTQLTNSMLSVHSWAILKSFCVCAGVLDVLDMLCASGVVGWRQLL
jgi:hypothetical protein